MEWKQLSLLLEGEDNIYTRFDDVDVKCPFYKGSNEKKISCEGITDDCIIILSFNSKAKRDIQKEIFCNQKYKNCEVCRMLLEKYEDQ